MTATFKAKSAADLLSAIPTMAGYNPADSVVIMPFCGTSSVGLFRFDLPLSDPAQFAATALGIVCRLEEATGMMVVIYAVDRDGEPGNHDFTELGAAMTLCADACGLDIGDLLFVFRNGWFGLEDTEVHSHDEIGDPPDVGGSKPKANQSAGTRLPRVDRARMSAVRSALAQIDTDLASTAPSAVIDRLENVHDLFESVIESAQGEVEDDAMLLWILGRPSLRDVALSQWCHGADAAAETLQNQLNWLEGIPYPPVDVFLMGEGKAPDVDRLRAALKRLRHLAASASGRDRAAPLACAAWISWALGLSTHADAYAKRALKAQPSHGLSQIIETMCVNGHLPEFLWSK